MDGQHSPSSFALSASAIKTKRCVEPEGPPSQIEAIILMLTGPPLIGRALIIRHHPANLSLRLHTATIAATNGKSKPRPNPAGFRIGGERPFPAP